MGLGKILFSHGDSRCIASRFSRVVNSERDAFRIRIPKSYDLRKPALAYGDSDRLFSSTFSLLNSIYYNDFEPNADTTTFER